MKSCKAQYTWVRKPGGATWLKTSTWNQVPGTSWRHKTATWNFLPQELLELPAQSVLPGVSPGASCKKLSGVLS